MQDSPWLKRVDWGHVALLALLSGGTVWYLMDAWSASARTRNLILILPASIVALALCAGIAAGILHRAMRGIDDGLGPEETASLYGRIRPLVLMGLFALYVFTLPNLGFDVGSGVFVALALIADGERRPLFLASYSAGFAVLATLAFQWLLPYPMPTLLL